MACDNHGSPEEDTALVSLCPSTSNSPQLPRPLSDLPDELLQAGWEKCWSKRESRPYYFNRFTNQSLWEMPVLGHHDVISDPLGLNAAPIPSDGATPETPKDNRPQKRRISEELLACDSVKKLKVESTPVTPASVPSSPVFPGVSLDEKQLAALIKPTDVYWDLDIQSNVVVKPPPPSHLLPPPSQALPPHPEVELLRSQLVLKLRQHYRELCQQREGIEPPRESFNRWLLERKVLDMGPDPLLPSDCDPTVSPSMFQEIMNDVPMRLSRIKHREEAKRLLFKYAEAAKRLIESRSASSDSRKLVKWNVEDTFSWLRRDHLATKEDYMDRLEHLRRQCGPHMAAVARDSVEGICSKIYRISREYVKRTREKHLALLREANIPEPGPPEAPPEKLVFCHPVRLSVPALHQQGGVDVHLEGSMVCVRFKGETVRVNQSYFSKLFQLYRFSCTDDPGSEKFLSRVWCLLRRYQVMFGTAQYEGSGLQEALPVHVFQALHRIFGVTSECFASPLNCYFKQYCSAFPDTDGYFGSRGPCLSFFPVSGSFEANPPFCEELLDAMVTHFENLLESSDQPLSFIIFIPEGRDPPISALIRMENSRFKRHQLVLSAYQHEYRSGAQYVCKRDELYYKAMHNTAVLFLQNEPGFLKWAPTPERVQELTAAFKHSGRLSNCSGGSEKESTQEEGTSKDSMTRDAD
ncbi:mRNA (2'-O-methyladenosine-N(6)-)-methyltransferase [Spea bombifrons]|uniref:mRNA (2'-O-methyladenosine-N(6)-)-methyltransferase n=1 Tax=Spea bombifrons TaxID=233779 RepID=UPI00234BDA90|nr:mRNA (2'-O-methyladenosine-N(6)-)-methyltransferase [Spea bombifrons]